MTQKNVVLIWSNAYLRLVDSCIVSCNSLLGMQMQVCYSVLFAQRAVWTSVACGDLFNNIKSEVFDDAINILWHAMIFSSKTCLIVPLCVMGAAASLLDSLSQLCSHAVITYGTVFVWIKFEESVCKYGVKFPGLLTVLQNCIVKCVGGTWPCGRKCSWL